MGTMSVTLDDGTEIEVPCRQREIKSREIGANPPQSIFVDEPLPHPDYEFRSVIGGVRAIPKRR